MNIQNGSIKAGLLTATQAKYAISYSHNYWTRTPVTTSESDQEVFIVKARSTDLGAKSIDSEECILPALYFTNMDDYNLRIGDVFEVGIDFFYNYVVITKNIALALEDIGVSIFDSFNNKYEGSVIEKYITEYFDNEISGGELNIIE